MKKRRKVSFHILSEEGMWQDPSVWENSIRNLEDTTYEDGKKTFEFLGPIRVSTLEGMRGT
jgi:hypothetical protein